MRPSSLITATFLGLAPVLTAAATSAQSVIELVMPNSASCAGAEKPDECRTAAQAASYLISAFEGFSAGSIASMLAVGAYESNEMQYNTNLENMGQGTFNMMLPKYISQYATAKLGASAVAGKSPSDVLALVTTDQYNFGSVSWFLTTQCSQSVQESVAQGTDQGWADYMGCIDVSPTDPGRLAYWTAAKSAFGLSG